MVSIIRPALYDLLLEEVPASSLVAVLLLLVLHVETALMYVQVVRWIVQVLFITVRAVPDAVPAITPTHVLAIVTLLLVIRAVLSPEEEVVASTVDRLVALIAVHPWEVVHLVPAPEGEVQAEDKNVKQKMV